MAQHDTCVTDISLTPAGHKMDIYTNWRTMTLGLPKLGICYDSIEQQISFSDSVFYVHEMCRGSSNLHIFKFLNYGKIEITFGNPEYKCIHKFIRLRITCL